VDILKSKKFQALLVGLIVVIVQQYIPGLDETKALEVVGLISAYILGQGFADWGKEKAKIEADRGLKSN
jgi:uncharacterized protein involved in cysteine biosynthesis